MTIDLNFKAPNPRLRLSLSLAFFWACKFFISEVVGLKETAIVPFFMTDIQINSQSYCLFLFMVILLDKQ